MSQIRNALLVACSLAAVSGGARAEDQSVVQRLSGHSGLSSYAAKKLVAKVSQRMARAADAPPSVMDPLRAALSQALIGSAAPADAMATAKVRLKLYAGLNEVALEALFAPQPGAIAACVRDVAVSQSDCEALVAAAARSSVNQVRGVAGGPAGAPAMATAAAPAAGAFGAPASGSRFGGRFNSGYQASAAPAQPAYQASAAPAQQGFGGGYRAPVAQAHQRPQGYQQQAPQGYAPRPAYAAQPAGYGQRPAYAAQPQPAYRGGYAAPAAAAAPTYRAPVQPAAPAAPVVSQQVLASRKDAYKAQREAYLARQKAEFQERKDKAAGLDTSGQSPAPAASANASPSGNHVSAPADESMAAADTKRPAAAAAPAPKSDVKPALDSDFLDGLLDDPLAKGKKK